MNEKPRFWFNQLIVVLMGSVGLHLIMQALHGVNTKEVLRMISSAAQCGILIAGMAWMRLNRLIRAEKVYVGNVSKAGGFDMILLGGLSFLQQNDPSQVPTTTVAFVIVMIVVLFFICPYLIGKILTGPDWTEEEEAMEAEFPQREASENWAELIPRYLARDVDGPDRSKISHKK